jgi:hypothetical protein
VLGGYLVLTLERRKNKPSGSRLVRGCWCRECRDTCPVHVLGELLANTEPGAKLFPGVSAGTALAALRTMLAVLKVPGAAEHRTHDLRRGHAKDLQMSGDILHSGVGHVL